jgi:hypothetical protein
MNKIPVGQTVRFAYAFTFGEIGTVIGLIWIPTLINAVASFFALRAYYHTLVDSLESGIPPSGAGVGLPFLLAFLAMLLVAMIGVSLTQQALGMRQGPAFAHIALGSAELRAFGGFFGLYLLFILFIAVVAIVLGIAAAGSATAIQANPRLGGPAGAAVGAAAVVGICAVVYAVIRLSFLLVPSVVDGGEFGLTRSWQLTKGNFWRIVAVGAATLLPIALIFATAELAILGPSFFVPDVTHGAVSGTNLSGLAAQMRAMQDHMPVLMGLSFVLSPLLYGLMFSASAFAYRALSGQGGVAARNQT